MYKFSILGGRRVHGLVPGVDMSRRAAVTRDACPPPIHEDPAPVVPIGRGGALTPLSRITGRTDSIGG